MGSAPVLITLRRDALVSTAATSEPSTPPSVGWALARRGTPDTGEASGTSTSIASAGGLDFNAGMTYTIGTTLSVPAGQGFSVSSATIADPLNCQGSIIATAGGAINLTNGLTLSGTGQVALGSGNLTISDSISGISGGSLAAATLYVASLSTGSFTQSAGTVLCRPISTLDTAEAERTA